MNPTPETCRRLTEYLSEEWHVPEWRCCDCGRQFTPNKSPLIEVPICAYCGSPNKDFALPDEENRTFTTHADLFAVYSKMVEKGEWEEFEAWAWDRWPDVGSFKHGISKYAAWLFCLNAPSQIGERMEMAGKWLEERK